MDNDSSFRSVGSRQGSPHQDEKNGNVNEEPGKFNRVNFLGIGVNALNGLT